METPVPPPIESNTESAPMVNVAEMPLKRAPMGWVLLAMAFVLLLSFKFLPERDSKKPELAETKKSAYAAEELSIRFGMNMRSLLLVMEQASPTKSGMSGKTQIGDDILEGLEEDAKSDPRAARLYVAAKHEAGQELTDADLSLVEKGTKPESQSFVAIYEAEKLNAQEAKSLSDKLPKKEFASDLARVHAFEKAGDDNPRLEMAPVWKGVVVMLVAVAVFGLGFIGIGLWIYYFIRRSAGQWHPIGHPAEPMTRPDADRFAYRAGMLMMLFLFLQVLIGFLMFSKVITSQALANFMLYSLMLVGVIFLHKVPAIGLPITLSRIGVSKRELGKQIIWGIGGYVAAIPIIFIGAIIGQLLIRFFDRPTHPATEMLQAGADPMTILAIFFGASIVAPIWEEIMFRGTLMPAIATILGRPLWGILISSFIFAAIHPQGVPLWLALGSIGAMNGLLAYQTKSLVPSIVLHAINNTAVLLLGVTLAAVF